MSRWAALFFFNMAKKAFFSSADLPCIAFVRARSGSSFRVKVMVVVLEGRLEECY